MKKKIFIIGIALMAVVITSVAFWSPTTRTLAVDYFFGSEPDLPPFMTEENSDIDKEEYMMRRSEAVALKRGIYKDVPFDRQLRPKAIEEMEVQQARVAELAGKSNLIESILAAWTPIGPAPIPNGQTTPSAPVSGRTTAIAIHPTLPNIVYVGTAQGGVYRSIDSGTNWTPIFDSAQVLAIGAIAIAPSNPEIVYVGTGEPNLAGDNYFGVGVYRIENASTTATLVGPLNKNAGGADVFTGRSVGEILVHPTNPDLIFVATTSGRDGFRSAANAPLPSRGIYRSNDATTANPTFAKLTGLAGNLNASVRDMAFDPQNPDNLVANVVAAPLAGPPVNPIGGIYTSNNALNADPTTVTFTQTQIFNATSTSELTAEFGVQKSGGTNGARTFYAATGNGGGRVLRSTDSGITWTQQIDNNFCTPQCFYDIAIDVDPVNVDTLYIGGSPNLIVGKSITGGSAFPIAPTAGLHVDTHALAVAPTDPLIVFLGTDGGIYRSGDGGVSFAILNNSQYSATQFVELSVHPIDSNYTIGGTQDNGTNFYSSAGAWTNVRGGDGGFSVIDQNAVDNVNVRMYHTFFNQVGSQLGYETRGTTTGTWVRRGCFGAAANGINCNDTAVNFYAPLEQGPGTPNTIYYGTDRIYRSSDLGVNHTVVSQAPIISGVPISSIGISPQNDNVRIVGLNGGQIFGTSTGATTLADLDPTNTVPNVPINRSIIDPNSQTTAYVTLSAFGVPSVWKTTNLGDAGTTWTNASGSGANTIPQVPVNSIVVDPMNSNYLYAATDIGVYSSIDGGGNWLPFGTGLPRVAVFDIKIVPGASPRLLRIATYGRGMYQIPVLVAPTAAGVTVEGRVAFSSGFGLGNASVTLTNSNGETRTEQTSSFGYFKFEDVGAGETYTVTVSHKRYSFTPQVITVNDNVENLNLFPQQ